MKISNHLKSKRGSSSILVILFVITLVVFGTLAMMSAYSDLKLAKKNAEWTKTYYNLDAQGEALLVKIDSCLKSASDESIVPVQPNASNKNQYFNLVAKKINALPEASKLSIINTGDDLKINTKIVYTGENSEQTLEIGLFVVYPENKQSNYPRYRIQKWVLTPATFIFDDTIQLWDGGITPQ